MTAAREALAKARETEDKKRKKISAASKEGTKRRAASKAAETGQPVTVAEVKAEPADASSVHAALDQLAAIMHRSEAAHA
jgi:hypothetical protein